jgi:type I restriction enzyme S subunit
MEQRKAPNNWPMMDFENVLEDVTRLSGKVKKRDYQLLGKFPIIDQGQTKIAGYSDVEGDLYSGKLPVILFGDHTCRFKFVDFPFLLGADGTKILKVVHPNSYPKFVFHYLNSLNLQPEGYRRHFSLLKKYQIPIPYPDDPARSLAEQRRIVAQLEAALDEVREMRDLQSQIEADVGRLMESVLAEVFPDPFQQLPSGWKTYQLQEITSEDSQQIRPSDRPEGVFNYWGLGVIDKGQVLEPQSNLIHGNEVASTCVQFGKEHVLYSRLRPYLNKVIVPSIEGIGSTEWVVLKPNPQIITREFLAFALRTRHFLKYAETHTRGARLPRLSKSALRSVPIPVPLGRDSLAIQQKIVAYLKAIAEETQEMLLQADSKTLDTLERSILAQAFEGEV